MLFLSFQGHVDAIIGVMYKMCLFKTFDFASTNMF